MKNWQKVVISETVTILEAMKAIEGGAQQICFVIDSEGRLVGSVSDGDLRRGILRGVGLERRVTEVMRQEPIALAEGVSRVAISALMTRAEVRVVPLVDREGRVSGVATKDELADRHIRDNPVMVMAGGLGKRLRPLTDNCPKPLLKVNGKPILEIILEGLAEAGFSEFIFSVNYRREMIEDYFKGGSHWGVRIQYVREDRPLGTAGSIALIPEAPKRPMLVINGDVITKVDCGKLVDYHVENEADATISVREYQTEIPFGVVDLDGPDLRRIREKPLECYFVNAGVYVLGRKAIDLVPKSKPYQMTDLFNDASSKGLRTKAYPVTEYWVDVGRHDDLDRAKRELVD